MHYLILVSIENMIKMLDSDFNNLSEVELISNNKGLFIIILYFNNNYT